MLRIDLVDQFNEGPGCRGAPADDIIEYANDYYGISLEGIIF
ncbi:MAG: hypothetical protein ACJAZM_002924 [Cyclobacteriaceae bacterium]|jgi:hypothetical protein